MAAGDDPGCGRPALQRRRKLANFTSPEALQALQWLVDYCKAGIGTSPTISDPNSPTGPFVAGRTAMTTVGDRFGEQIETDLYHLTSFLINAPTPNWQGARLSECMAGVGMSITSGSKNKDAAWKLVEWFNTGQPAIDRAKGGWGLASLKSNQKYLPSLTAFDRERMQVVQNDLKHFKPIINSPWADFGSTATALATAIQQVVQGKTSLASAAKSVETTVNKLIKQGIESSS